MRKIKLFLTLFCVLAIQSIGNAQTPSDYLILQDIGSYKFSTQSINPVTDEVKQIPGYTVTKSPGMLKGAGHFKTDHKDTTYTTGYESDVADLSVKVQVTQHTGGDSDRWLLHEIETGFRNAKVYRLGLLNSHKIREKDNGNKIFFRGLVYGYRWVSNNIVVISPIQI